MSDSLASRRIQYETAGLDRADLADDPLSQWRRWYDDAEAAGCVEPNAMVLSTVDGDGAADSRYVLVRGVTATTISFFTSYESTKSAQMRNRPDVAGLFTWLQLHRQLRIRGTAAPLDDAASDAYFATRPRPSQIGAWASAQSSVLVDRAALEDEVAAIERRFDDVAQIPRPPDWGGWQITVTSAEVWQGRPSRLHDRFRYTLDGASWVIERLAP